MLTFFQSPTLGEPLRRLWKQLRPVPVSTVQIWNGRMINVFASCISSGRRIGKAHLAWKGTTAELLELRVNDGYRGIGVGTRLLADVLKAARRAGVKRVVGFVSESDYVPALISLYQKHHFEIVPDPSLPASYVARIVKNL